MHLIERTHSSDLPPVNCPEQVIEDLVAIRETHLTRTQGCWVGVCPSHFDAFTAGPSGSGCVVEIERAFAIFTVHFKVKLGNDKIDLQVIRELIYVTVDFLEPLPEIDGPSAANVLRESKCLQIF